MSGDEEFRKAISSPINRDSDAYLPGGTLPPYLPLPSLQVRVKSG